MILSPTNKLYLRRLLKSKALRIAALLFCLFNFIDVLRIHQKFAYEHRHHHAKSIGYTRERIYIASMHFNDAKILDHWGAELLQLVDLLGAENLFVSIQESGSWDDTKRHLRSLDHELESRGVSRRVVLSDVTHKDEITSTDRGAGWIDTSRNRKELRRIPYLARLRNKTIEDLVDLAKKGITFDKVLFLNDVIFTVDDVLTLMDTNGGDYAAACSLDFSNPPLYYDTFALRDVEGSPHIMQTWPYFKARGSRNPLVNNLDAVPVTSCWNGIVVMPAEPFVSSTKLRFRGVSDSLAKYHLEGSECCLIHADNPLSKSMGVYLNPRVRVAYNFNAYEATHRGSSWVTPFGILKGLWLNRIKRWTLVTFETWTVRSRMKRWKNEDNNNHEPGDFCLINEMQVLVENGWAHV